MESVLFDKDFIKEWITNLHWLKPMMLEILSGAIPVKWSWMSEKNNTYQIKQKTKYIKTKEQINKRN